MWLLAKGSVSVRHISTDGHVNRRGASLSRGTTIGEMALVDKTRRSATIVADEHVVGYELLRDGYGSGRRPDEPWEAFQRELQQCDCHQLRRLVVGALAEPPNTSCDATFGDEQRSVRTCRAV